MAAPADIFQIFFLHDSVHGFVIDRKALVFQLDTDSVVAVAALMLHVDGLYPAAFIGVAVGLFTEMVIVCRAG